MKLSQWFIALTFSCHITWQYLICKKHSRYRKAFYHAVEAQEWWQRSWLIPQASLLPIQDLKWSKVLKSRVDQSLITLQGFDVESFFYLCKKISSFFWRLFSFYWIILKRSSRGRKRLIRVEDCVVLFMAWTRTRGTMFVLQMMFGATQSYISCYLWYGRCL